MDSDLVVIIFIANCMIISVPFILSFVRYEWCPILFENNSVHFNHTEWNWLFNTNLSLEHLSCACTNLVQLYWVTPMVGK